MVSTYHIEIRGAFSNLRNASLSFRGNERGSPRTETILGIRRPRGELLAAGCQLPSRFEYASQLVDVRARSDLYRMCLGGHKLGYRIWRRVMSVRQMTTTWIQGDGSSIPFWVHTFCWIRPDDGRHDVRGWLPPTVQCKNFLFIQDRTPHFSSSRA